MGTLLARLNLPRNVFSGLIFASNLARATNEKLPMNGFSSLRVRLVGTVLLALTPAWVLMYLNYLPWPGFFVGLLALAAAWYGGERFVFRQVRRLHQATYRLASGDLTARTGLTNDPGEFGMLARTFDEMAASLEKRAKQQATFEKDLLQRSMQQTVMGALGQYAIVCTDLSALFEQAVMLAVQTLEVEFCRLLEPIPESDELILKSGVGWKQGVIGKEKFSTQPDTESSLTIHAGVPVVIENLATETRFQPDAFLAEHGIVSGIEVAISGHGRTFGVIGAYTAKQRKFTEEEVHFLLSLSNLLAMTIERHQSQSELQKLATFTQLNPNPAMELAENGRITYFNDAALRLAISAGQDHPRGILPANVGEIAATCLATRHSRVRLETRMGGRTVSWSFHPVLPSKVVHAYAEDVTERLSLESQLRHSQKMDSVGQLAAGVAHDFNNMLTVIQGHSGMLLTNPALPRELQESIQAIYVASERAAGLTRQLLMFSRKNVMQPKLLDLREVVANLSKMLERLLGATVKLEVNAPPFIPPLRGDAGMIEQVLMNLSVNARDAMPKGGTLSISTSSTEVDDRYVATHPEARPGMFVCLQVTDDGIGMDTSTMRRIFEPFFTTKEVGKGTGLGLATVYGIVKQHEGWIEVSSQPRLGTTFTVFFPAAGDPVSRLPAEAVPDTEIFGGKETILLVEDEPVVRDLAQVILSDCGYKVLQASTGAEALSVWERNKGNIQLLITDMVMPEGMSGMELAERLHHTNPRLKIIFASGYSMDDLDTDFVRQGLARVLQKPYTHITLPVAVRECLDN
jgi:signal transduction histidine kinase/HAMP domain-containing protein